MYLTQSMQDFILHWGEMGQKWGTNRSVAQIHALLHISPEPLSADEICDLLNLARSNVSNGLKELQSLGMVQTSRKLGDRRDHFHSIRDMFELVQTVVESRRAREYAPTLKALQKVQEEAEHDATPQDVKARFAETLETMQMFDDWYAEVNRLPRSVQLALVKMGARIARFLPKAKSSE
ncbi:MarR family transcriptional regulator [Tateyamaria sp. ANG-S1]|uniref:GbsR/MarR family transcriptional regulator n=1 Tax=Tateyamaria sp. ANG-S1 TaxID=1577905 RepID=UPI00057DB576|nr:MarR family transcriptional regulator [Tateyamaria sp. ANG-S1]KIC47938.1 ArsR family transcriptional regulator [Tateyamaria sp. ANG-S1]